MQRALLCYSHLGRHGGSSACDTTRMRIYAVECTRLPGLGLGYSQREAIVSHTDASVATAPDVKAYSDRRERNGRIYYFSLRYPDSLDTSVQSYSI